MTRVLHKHLLAAGFALRLRKLGGMRLGRCKERTEDGAGLGLRRRGRTLWMEQWVLRAAVPPGQAVLGLLNPRPGQQGCESKCVKKPSGPFTDSRICSHGGSLGAAGHGPLTWKHPQHISLGWCAKGEMSSRRPSPGRDPEPVCCDSSTPGSDLYMRN